MGRYLYVVDEEGHELCGSRRWLGSSEFPDDAEKVRGTLIAICGGTCIVLEGDDSVEPSIRA